MKAGIEAKDGVGHISVVARETWADWSLTPTSPDLNARGWLAENLTLATLDFEKSGNSLKVYVTEGVNGERRMIRQIQWVFMEQEEDVWVGVYAARPDPLKEADGKDLEVKFSDFEIGES